MVVSAAGHAGEVPSFADRLGERLVVAQPSGVLLEFLVFHPALSSAPFFETSVKGRLKRLSNFRHAAYARATRLQRDPLRGNRLTLVSAYTPGRRLADLMVLARRGRVQPRISAVLSMAKQLMTGAALLHDYAPDVFHGALGPDRIVVGSDGRLTITEYVLGTAIEQAVTEWGVPRLWREYRVPALSDTSLTRFGRRLDLVQIGLVTLCLLAGRQLADADFPDRIGDLLDAAHETTTDGESVPLGEQLRDWLGKMLCIEPSAAFRTLIEAQKAFGRLVEEDARYGVSSHAVEAFFNQCEESGPLPAVQPEPPTDAPPAAAAVVVVPAVTPPVEQPLADAPAPALPAESSSLPEPVTDASPQPLAPPPAASSSSQAAMTTAPTSQGADEAEDLADLLAALPATKAQKEGFNPFDPWPSVPNPDAAALVPPATEPESPAAPLPALEEEAPGADAARTASVPSFELVTNGWDSGSLQPLPVPSEIRKPERDPVPSTPSVATAPAWAFSEPVPAPMASAKVQAASVEAPPSAAASAAHQVAADPPGVRKAAVLSYDDVHRTSAKRRSRAPFAWIAVALLLSAAAVLGGPRLVSLVKHSGKANAPATPATSAKMVPGGFRITTQPPGSMVSIDGTPRGKAPLRVDDLAPGVHSIVVESSWGTLEEAFTVEPGKVTPLTLATVGWIKVEAPVELQVSEEGRVYGSTTGALMVPAGRHTFVFTNPSVAVRLRQFVQVPAGETLRIPLDLPKGMMNLTSDQPALVIVDGEPIGDAPQTSVPASLGPHEVVFRNAKYGDVSYTINVTLAAPVRLSANFAAKR